PKSSKIPDKVRKSARLEKPVLGWREWLGVPELGIVSVKAKVDTGARSSSMHAENIEIFKQDGARFVAFELEHSAELILRGGKPHRVHLPLFDLRWITSSN